MLVNFKRRLTNGWKAYNMLDSFIYRLLDFIVNTYEKFRERLIKKSLPKDKGAKKNGKS